MEKSLGAQKSMWSLPKNLSQFQCKMVERRTPKAAILQAFLAEIKPGPT